MTKQSIRIITKAGNIITRKATISTMTSYDIAVVGRSAYIIVSRDANGALWAIKSQ